MPNEDQSSDNLGFPIIPYSTTLHWWGCLKIHFSIQIINHSKHLPHPNKKKKKVTEYCQDLNLEEEPLEFFSKIMNLDNSKILT